MKSHETAERPTGAHHAGCWFFALIGTPIIYVLSSGPVMAIAFWLRESTGWDGFYAVMFLYYPLLVWGHHGPIGAYVEWWVELLGTVGPG